MPVNGQDTISAVQKVNSLHPASIYHKKQDLLRSKLNVEKQISFSYKYGPRDTLRYKVYDVNGKFRYHYYPKKNSLGKYSNVLIDSLDVVQLEPKIEIGNTTNLEDGEAITRDSSGNIIKRLRGYYFNDHRSYIYELIDERSQRVKYRTFLLLDQDQNILSNSVSNGGTNFTIYYHYNPKGERTKSIRCDNQKTEPEIIHFTYFSNGLLKSKVQDGRIVEYEYQFRK